MPTIEIADNVFVIPVPMSERLDTSILALRGERLVLVDAGIPGAGPKAVAHFAAQHSCGPIDAMLCTHFHRDHTGGIAELRESLDFPVYAHVAEGHLLAEPGDFGRAFTMSGATPPPVSAGIKPEGILDGFVIHVGSRQWEAIHVPGHTWGHLAFWSESDRILIAGDSIQGAGISYHGVPGQGTGLPYYLDAQAYRRSLERMQFLAPELLVMSHEVPPWGDRVISGSAEITEVFDSSLKETARIDALVRSAVSDLKGATLMDVAASVCRESGMAGVTAQATLTVRAHLVDLATRGEVSVHKAEWSMNGKKPE